MGYQNARIPVLHNNIKSYLYELFIVCLSLQNMSLFPTLSIHCNLSGGCRMLDSAYPVEHVCYLLFIYYLLLLVYFVFSLFIMYLFLVYFYNRCSTHNMIRSIHTRENTHTNSFQIPYFYCCCGVRPPSFSYYILVSIGLTFVARV